MGLLSPPELSCNRQLLPYYRHRPRDLGGAVTVPDQALSALVCTGDRIRDCVRLAYGAFLYSPRLENGGRLYGLFGLGLGAGTLNTGILQAISPSYRLQPAGTINLAGVFFGLGSSVAAILVAGTFAIYTVGSILFLVALVPAFFAIMYSRARLSADRVTQRRSLREVAVEFTIPSAVLFSLLLFCQFGNEWAIAGWLPLFVITRLGVSPTTGLLILTEYWLCLMLGRLIAQASLSRVKHGRMLLSAVIASMLGCAILGLTDNLFGAISGTLLVGLGFAPIYPLVVEKIGARFPHYHPGFFNGIFSLALTGGMLAPAVLGYAAEYSGIRVVMALPMIGSIVVVILVLLIWLETKLLGPAVEAKPGIRGFYFLRFSRLLPFWRFFRRDP